MTAYLFDLDGTLADTLPIILKTARLALAELEREVTDQEIVALIGVPLVQTGEMLLGPGQGELYRECYQKHFRRLDISGLTAFPGIIPMMDALKEKGGRLALVTSKRQGPAEQTLGLIGLSDHFEALVNADNCAEHKPAPGPALRALEMLGLAPDQRAVFIGDSIFDIKCAVAAGIASCGVTWGAGQEQDLREAGADFIADTVAELSEILLGLL